MLTTRSRAYAIPTFLFVGLAFALANGMAYGCSNLRQYLLHGLHAIDPGFLANDWFTAQTQAHHSAFNQLIVWMSEVTSLPVAFAGANAIFAIGLLACVYLAAKRLYASAMVVTALVALLVILVPRPYLGMTGILSIYFQPATIGAVGMLAGLTCLGCGRPRAAGLCFFVSGLFHINYMVWNILLAGAVVMLNMRQLGIRKAMWVIVPIGFAVLYHLPFIAASRSAEQLAAADAASWILHDVYMPCHSRPLTWGIEPFLRFGALVAAGLIAWRLIPPSNRPGRMFTTIAWTYTAAIAFGIVFTTVLPIDFVALIFPYRLGPFMALGAMVGMVGAVVRGAEDERVGWWRILVTCGVSGAALWYAGVNAYGLSCIAALTLGLQVRRVSMIPGWVKPAAGLLALVICARMFGGGMMCTALVAGLGVLAMARRVAESVPVASEGQRFLQRIRRISASLSPARVLVPFCVAIFLSQVGSTRKDLAGPPPPADEQILYDWCRNRTERDSVFIIPPGLGSFRFRAERAVVADWKCMPILPSDTLEWYRRLCELSGDPFESYSELVDGFNTLDTSRARDLARTYDARYLVTLRDHHNGDLADLRPAFQTGQFAVMHLSD